MNIKLPKISRKYKIFGTVALAAIGYLGYQKYSHSDNYAFYGTLEKPNGAKVPCTYEENIFYINEDRLRNFDLWNSFGYANIMTMHYDNAKLMYIDFINKKDINSSHYDNASIDDIVLRNPDGSEKILMFEDCGFSRETGAQFYVANRDYSFIRRKHIMDKLERELPELKKYLVNL